MKCLIIDDEPLAVNLLKDYASKVPDLEVVFAGTDVYAGLQLAQQGEADLVFLDIQMPELTGIQFMKILNGKCKIILTTAYEEYALQAFDHDVVDYLLKPFSPERFMIAVNKVRERLKQQAPAQRSEAPDYIFVKSEYKILKVGLRDIYYFESLRDYVAIHTTTGKIMTLQSLKSFEEQLPAADFIRVHKSYIIRLDRITHVERNRVVMNGIYIPISDTYRESVSQRLKV